MRTEHLLVWLTALLLSFALIAFGALFLLNPDNVLDRDTIGIVSISCGLFFLILVFFSSRRRYLLFKMGGLAIHERVLNHYVQQELKTFFPNKIVDCDVIVHRKGKVEILANIPYLSEEKLEEMETSVAASLSKYCGYKGPFLFNVSFS